MPYNVHLRVARAAEDFRLMGMGDRITVRHRDVCGPDGFSPVADSSVDAVFLDLPQVCREARECGCTLC